MRLRLPCGSALDNNAVVSLKLGSFLLFKNDQQNLCRAHSFYSPFGPALNNKAVVSASLRLGVF
jgi:hypothetical protein